MPETKKRTIFKATVAGREVPVYEATHTQVAFIGRYTNHATKALEAGDTQAALFAVGDVLDILDSLIVEATDRAHLSKLMMTGELEAQEFIQAWHEAMPDSTPQNGPAPKVTRGKVAK